jgi:protein involved in polysaccharide export with SLBB domain
MLFSNEVKDAEVIEPGDKVQLQITGVLGKLYDVYEDGRIDFGLWGKVWVAGRNKEEALVAIKTALRPYIRNLDQKKIFLAIKKKESVKNKDYVSVFGEVRVPGLYVYMPHLGILDYIMRAQGTTRFALSDSIKVIFLKNGKIKAQVFNLQKLSAGVVTNIPKITKGMIIYVPEKPAEKASWLRNRPNQVIYIFGQVWRPGRYEFNSESGFMDIFSHAGGMTLQADPTQISIISNGEVKIFNMDEFLKKGGKLPAVKTGDAVFVPERERTFTASWTKVPSGKSIFIIGEVNNPGRYDFLPSLGFLDVLSQTGGPTDKADTKRVAIIRNHKLKVTFDLYAYQKGKQNQFPQLKPMDLIYIPRTNIEYWVKKDPGTVVNIIGEVAKQGRYEIEPNMSILDVLASAGLGSQANIARIRILNPEEKSYVFNLKKWIKKGDFRKLPLIKGGDTIMIPKKRKKGALLKDIKNIIMNVAVIYAASEITKK